VAIRLPAGLVRAIRLTAIAVAVLVLVGATYQGVATALERHRYPRPGRMIDIGDHQLHLYCTGTGSPTVVLEAPATGMSSAWGLVQPSVAKLTRVCSYDRAGLGWSEAGDRGYSPARVPDELHTLLMNAHERAPYVLIGEGLGAAFAQIYASRYGEDVAALIRVDAPVGTDGPGDPRVTRLVSASPWLARVGVLRAARVLSKRADGLPRPALGPMQAFLNRPDHLTRAAEELSQWNATIELAHDAPVPPRIVDETIAIGRGPAQYLTDPADAARVVDATSDVVARVRGRSSSSSPSVQAAR
jgi:pimeloyl-ACP methyl ester carboxylesterase